MSLDRAAQASDEPTDADALIRTANQTLTTRTGDKLSLPIAVLIEQRDEALRQNAALREHARGERAALIAEQDQFITFLMSDHEAKLLKLGEELKSARETVARQRSLERPPAEAGSALDPGEAGAEIERLKQLLEAAYAEADETRNDAASLQAELDDAVRATDDVRLELRSEVDAARDDAFRIQSQLDETNRLLEDGRDQARDEAFRFSEELDDARRELDERVAEVRRLRQRLTELDVTRNSLPPPPTSANELEVARADQQILRKQLIETKRELSRVTRELELQQTRRVARPASNAGLRAVDPARIKDRKSTPAPSEIKPP